MSDFEEARARLRAFEASPSDDEKLSHAEEFLSILGEVLRDGVQDDPRYLNLLTTGLRVFRHEIKSTLMQETAEVEKLYFAYRLTETVESEGYPFDSNHERLKSGIRERLRELVRRDPEIRALAELKNLDVLDSYLALMSYSPMDRARILNNPSVRERVQELQRLDDELSWTYKVEAVAQLKKWSFGDAQEALRGFPPEKRNKVLTNPQVMKLAREIQEKTETTPPVSLDDLIAP
jgi:hypothetical protein